MSRTRAERRHHHQRMIDKVIKSFRWLKPEFYHGEEAQRQKHIKKMAENRAKCSCEICCNPRRSPLTSGEEKMTIQERKAKEKDFE